MRRDLGRGFCLSPYLLALRSANTEGARTGSVVTMSAQELPRLRFLLTSLRWLGVVPYTLTSASSSPQLQIRWLMWSIFMIFSMTCISYVSLRNLDVIYQGHIGFSSAVVSFYGTVMQNILSAMLFCIALKSKTLVRAYQILSENVTDDQTPSRVTIVDCCVVMIHCIFLPYVTVFFISLPIHCIELTFITTYTWAIYFILTAYILTFKYINSAISQKLFDEVQRAITSSTNHLNNGNDRKIIGGDVTATIPAFNQLEREICTVSHSVLKLWQNDTIHFNALVLRSWLDRYLFLSFFFRTEWRLVSIIFWSFLRFYFPGVVCSYVKLDHFLVYGNE